MVAVVDSNVLYGWRNANDQYHSRSNDIVDESKNERFPTLHIPDVFYVETVKHVHNELGYDETLDTVEMIRDAPQFSVIVLGEQDYNLGRALLRYHREIELPDAIATAYMRREQIEHVYSFDGGFDQFDDLTQLNAAIVPSD
jgi:predicted nucleic acid-binding protein